MKSFNNRQNKLLWRKLFHHPGKPGEVIRSSQKKETQKFFEKKSRVPSRDFSISGGSQNED